MIRKKKAFTLVELLVVIAIIALLVSILLPALARAREQAKRVICATNLNRIGYLLIQYSADNNEFYPPSYSANYPYGADSRPADQGGHGEALIGVLPYLYGGTNYEKLRSDHENKMMKIFWCPSGIVKYNPDEWLSSAFAIFGYNQYFSHSWGQVIIGTNTASFMPVNGEDMHSPQRSTSPSHWVTVADISIWGYPRWYRFWEDLWWRSNHPSTISRSGPGGGTTEHFAEGMNGLYVDGSVKWTATNGEFENLIRLKNELSATQQPSAWLFPKGY